MSNPLDDPTCHYCPIAIMLRERIEDLLSELGIAKGTTRKMPGVQRVSHGEANDEDET